MSQYCPRYLERVLGFGSACALVGGIAALDERVRTFVAGAFVDASFDRLTLSVGHGRQIVHTLYASVSSNPMYEPMAIFGAVAAGLTLLMMRT